MSDDNGFFIVLRNLVVENASLSLAWVGAKDGSRAYELIVDGVVQTVGTKKKCKAAWTKWIRRLNKRKGGAT